MSPIAPEVCLFTGSRLWADESAVDAVLGGLEPHARIVHGGCPDGLDAIADRLARARGFAVEPWRVPNESWRYFGGYAGPERNHRMVQQTRPTRVYAFPVPGCRGTWDCVWSAAKQPETRIFIWCADTRKAVDSTDRLRAATGEQ